MNAKYFYCFKLITSGLESNQQMIRTNHPVSDDSTKENAKKNYQFTEFYLLITCGKKRTFANSGECQIPSPNNNTCRIDL